MSLFRSWHNRLAWIVLLAALLVLFLLRMAPAMGALYRNLGSVLLTRASTMSSTPTLLAEARVAYRVATEWDGGSSVAYRSLGKVARLAEGPRYAIPWYLHALTLNPEDALTHYELGNAYWAIGQKAEARTQWRMAGALDALTGRWLNIGVAEFTKGNREEAERAFLMMVDIDPGSVQGYYLLASLYWNWKWEEADWALERAIEIDPSPSYSTLYSKGRLYFIRSQWPEAIAALQQATVLDPRSNAACTLLGFALWRAGRLDEAAAQLRRCVNTAADPWPIIYLGGVLRDKGDLPGAQDAFSTAALLVPQDAEVRANLGRVYRAQGQWTNAIVALQAAVALAPEDKIYHRELAEAYQEVGRLQDAMAEYRAVLALDPSDSFAQQRLRELLSP